MELDHNEGRNFSISRFEAMLKTNDVLFFDADEFELIICHYLTIGNMALANKAVKIGLSQHPQSSVLKLLKVEILLIKNKLEEAEEILEELYNLEPYNPDVYIHKANILSKKYRHEEAIELLKTATDILDDDEDEEVCSAIAMEYMFMDDYEQAKYYFMKCLEYDEEDSAALYNIIYCFDFLEQPEKAISFLNIYLDKHPYSEVGWHQIGLQYVAMKDYEKALTCFDFAVISDDYFVGAYMEKAKVLEKLKRFSEAIECYEITMDFEDPTAFAYLRIGKCHEKLNQKKLAIKSYNKALQEDPLMDKTWIAITDFYLHQNKYRQALYYIERAIAIDEDNASYWKRYAKINEYLKNQDEAEIGFQKILELDIDDLETRIKQADLFIGMQHFELALEVLEEAKDFYPFTAEIEFRLAGTAFSLNKEEAGLMHLKKGLRIDAEYVLIIEDLFPKIFARETLQKVIDKYYF